MSIDIKEPWRYLDAQIQGTFEKELEHELSSAHPLYHRKLTAVARSYASEDVLFHEASTDQYYLIHLTWNRSNNDTSPVFQTFPTLNAFIQHCTDTFQFHED